MRTPDEKHVMMLAPDGRGLIRDMTAGTSREMRLSMDAVVATGGGPAEVVRLWDIESQQPVVSLGVGRGNFIETAFSPDGTVLGSASHTGQFRLWRAPSQEEIEAAERPRAATAEK